MKTPESIAFVLESMLKKRGIGKKLKQYSLFEQWQDIVGQVIAKQTAPKRMQGNVLIVTASSHAWVQELTFVKPMIMKKITEAEPDSQITDIRFIVGKL